MSMIIGRKQIILAALVVALAAAIFLNWRFSQPGNSFNLAAVMNNSSGTLGQAAYVDNQKVGSGSASATDYFAQARLTRQQNLAKSKELLNSIATDSSATSSQKDQAVSGISALAGNVNCEGNIESLILAKGFKGCVAIISDGKVNVVVRPKGVSSLSQSDIVQIKDIVVKQAKVTADQITIIEKK